MFSHLLLIGKKEQRDSNSDSDSEPSDSNGSESLGVCTLDGRGGSDSSQTNC